MNPFRRRAEAAAELREEVSATVERVSDASTAALVAFTLVSLVAVAALALAAASYRKASR